MLRIGITGQHGFVGTHLYNTLGLYPKEFTRVEFQKKYFTNEKEMDSFVAQCDVIVHLAAMNRHNDPEVIYKTNLELVQKLIASLNRSESKAHIIMSSSSQEERDNPYGKSKKEGRERFVEWAKEAKALLQGWLFQMYLAPSGIHITIPW